MPAKGTKRTKAQPKTTRAKTSKASAPAAKGTGTSLNTNMEEVPEDTTTFSESRCIGWFRQFVEKPKGRGKSASPHMERNGLVKFCEAVGIDQNDIAAIVLSKKLGLNSMVETVSQASWIGTMRDLECDSNEKLRKKLPDLLMEVKKRSELVALCEYAFGIAKQPGEKAVANDVALELFSMMLNSSWKLFPDFAQFFPASGTKGVSLDTFVGVCDLANRHPDLQSAKTYDAALAWPSLADEFMEFLIQKLPGNGINTEN